MLNKDPDSFARELYTRFPYHQSPKIGTSDAMFSDLIRTLLASLFPLPS